MNTQVKRKFGVVPLVIAFLVFYGVYSFFWSEPEAQPKSAEGLTEEQRASNDVPVLMSEIDNVEEIEIDYGVDGIIVYLTQKSSDQYVSETAQDVEDAIRKAIDSRRADLTLEKEAADYFVYVYGSDRSLIRH